jgi:hypothetical protein
MPPDDCARPKRSRIGLGSIHDGAFDPSIDHPTWEVEPNLDCDEIVDVWMTAAATG